MTNYTRGWPMPKCVRHIVLAALTILSSAAYPAYAAAQTSNAALAEALYEQGRQLMDQGNYEAACDKFQQSQKLDPAGGTLLNLSKCLEQTGKIASAWSAYKEALAAARRDGRDDRAVHVEERLKALQSKLSHVTLRIPEKSQLSGLSVKLDDVELGSAAWNIAMPIDPGTHRITATAPGKQPFQREIQVGAEADNQIVEIPALKDHASSEAEAEAEAEAGVPSAGGGSRTFGYVLGAVGIAALGVGSYFGVRAFSEWNRRNELCSPGCTADAVDAHDSAQTAATISTISVGVGLLAVAAGAYFVLSAPSPPGDVARQTPRIEPRRVWMDANLTAGGGAVTVGSVF